MSTLHNPGELLAERYEIQNYLNEGGMQFVFVAKDIILDRKVALKTPKNNSALKSFERSAIVSAKVNHPNVAKTLDYFEIGDRPYLIEEYIDGKDLESGFVKKMKNIDPYMAARIFHHLSKGLAAAHHVNVIHRDLKPKNIIVSNDPGFEIIKITDFGIAKMAGEELTEAAEGGSDSISASATAVGALPYMSPEAIETPKEVSLPTDVWSIGAMMYELMTSEKPFGAGLRAVSKIVSGIQPEFPKFVLSNNQFSPLAKQIAELILKCLQKDSALRPTADQLVELCGSLCYPVSKRELGKVKLIKFNSWGFITSSEDFEDVFFHFDSVYGDRPSVGHNVVFSKFPGGGAFRAHPVIKID